MEDSTRVYVLKSTQDLIDEKLNVFVAETLVGFDDLAEVGFHQFRYHVDLVESFQTLWSENSLNGKHVFMVQQTHDFEFSQGTEGKNFMLKSFLDLLNCHKLLFFLRFIFCGDNDSICTRADGVDNFVLVRKLETGPEHFVGLETMASGCVGGADRLNFLLPVILLHVFSDFRLSVDHT